MRDVTTCYRMGRFAAGVDAWEAAAHTGPARAHGVRCLLHLGFLARAATACRDALDDATLSPSWRTRFQLLHAECDAVRNGDPRPAFDAARAAAAWADAHDDRLVAAHAAHLLGRCTETAVSLYLLDASHRADASEALAAAEAGFRAAGDAFEACAAARVRARVDAARGADPATIKRRLRDVEAEAVANGWWVLATRAALRLAALPSDGPDSEDANSEGGDSEGLTRDPATWPGAYRRALAHAETGAAPTGQVDVRLEWAARVRDPSVAMAILDEALALAASPPYPTGRYRAQTALAKAHLVAGSLERALEAYDAAAAGAEAAGFHAGLANTQLGKGEAQLRNGRVRDAHASFDAALTRTAVPTVRASIHHNRANLFQASNDTEAALQEVKRALDALDDGGSPDLRSTVYLTWGHLLVGRRQWREAARVWRTGADVDDTLGLEIAALRKRGSAAWIEMLSERNADGSLPAEAARSARQTLNDVLAGVADRDGWEALQVQAETHQHLAQVALMTGAHRDGADPLTQAATVFDALGDPGQVAFTRAQAGLAYWEAARASGRGFEAAIDRFREALDFFDASRHLGVTWQIRFHAAAASAEAGRAASDPQRRHAWREQALAWATQAAHDAESIDARFASVHGAGGSPPAAASDADLIRQGADKGKIYDLGIRVALALHRAETAWAWLERSKGAALRQLLAFAPLGGLDAVAPEAARRERAWLRALQTPDARTVQDALAALEALWSELEGVPEAEEHLAMRRGTPVRPHDVRPLLRPPSPNASPSRSTMSDRRIVLVEYYTHDEGTLVFGLDADRETPDVVSLDVSGPEIETVAQALVGTVAYDDGNPRIGFHPASFDASRQAAWASLDVLVEPLRRWAAPDDVVCLVPHGALHALPLHALGLDGAPLIERHPVATVPSASVLRYVRQRRGGPLDRSAWTAAVFGDPDVRGAARQLAGARNEAEAVARQFGTTPVLDRDATRDAFVRGIRDVDVVHFAGHALYEAGAPMESGIALAGADVFTAQDFFALEGMRAQLVTLSGCETGMSERRSGDELVGLSRAVLYAGARSMITSLWRLGDASARTFFETLYASLRASSDTWLVDAFRDAMRTTRNTGAPLYRWAPFTLIGDWR